MITYDKGIFSLNLLFRFHGSAVYRAMLPGLLSVGFYLLIHVVWHDNESHDSGDEDLGHPYAVGLLVSSVTFLIVFRTNQGYGRYWEATGAVFHMMSKWLDAATHTGSFHLQSDQYDKIKPPSFYDHAELDRHYLTRDRERGRSSSTLRPKEFIKERAIAKSIQVVTNKSHRSTSAASFQASVRNLKFSDTEPRPLTGEPRLDGGWATYYGSGSATFFDPDDENWAFSEGFAGTKGGRTPPLFLQELAHLASLTTAVALSTLRNDVEGAESPLDVYEPGAPWPAVDPATIKPNRADQSTMTVLKHYFGADRTPAQRTKYNASRPLGVLGGVSDSEIRFLQMARGPSAKTQLCWNWLSECIVREHLAGTMGQIGSPIISRVMQFLSDGMIYYNHARKIMFIPFPFPHAQLSVFYVMLMVPCIPYLLEQYTTETWLGVVLTFFSTTCLVALHEVARELENPFRNVPNELPLVTLQAMFNESLLTMYAGFHPDSYWDGDSSRSNGGFSTQQSMRSVPETDEPLEKATRGTTDTAQLHKLVEEQGKEIERLRAIVEDVKPKSS